MKIFLTTLLSLFPSSFFLYFFLPFQCFHSFSPFWFMKWNNFPDHQTLSGFWGALHGGKGGGREGGEFLKNQRISKYQSTVTRQYSHRSKYNNTTIWAATTNGSFFKLQQQTFLGHAHEWIEGEYRLRRRFLKKNPRIS